MVAIRAQVILHTVDAIPENFASNSFAFEVDSALSAPANLTPIIKDFYDDLVAFFSPVVAQANHEIKYTLLPGTPPNYPFDLDTFNLVSAPAGTALPDEVAVCLSFQGDRQAGFPQARRRGRIYFGPLDNTSATANRPSTGILTNMGLAAATFGAAVDAIGGSYAWGVWSQVDQALVPVTDGWIDNSFDTQRRRGVISTARTTFVV